MRTLFVIQVFCVFAKRCFIPHPKFVIMSCTAYRQASGLRIIAKKKNEISTTVQQGAPVSKHKSLRQNRNESRTHSVANGGNSTLCLISRQNPGCRRMSNPGNPWQHSRQFSNGKIQAGKRAAL